MPACSRASTAGFCFSFRADRPGAHLASQAVPRFWYADDATAAIPEHVLARESMQVSFPTRSFNIFQSLAHTYMSIGASLYVKPHIPRTHFLYNIRMLYVVYIETPMQPQILNALPPLSCLGGLSPNPQNLNPQLPPLPCLTASLRFAPEDAVRHIEINIFSHRTRGVACGSV